MKSIAKINGSCAITALQYAADTTEEKALKVCIGQGLFDEQWMKAADELGLKIKRVVYKPIQLKRFLKKYPVGLYIMGSHNHLFVVDNGRVVDPAWGSDGLYRKIISAYEVV